MSDEIIDPLGGKYEPPKDSNWAPFFSSPFKYLKNFQDFMKARNENLISINPDMFFINRLEINAISIYSKPNELWIGLFSGVAFQLYDTFFRLFSCEYFVPEIGKETSSRGWNVPFVSILDIQNNNFSVFEKKEQNIFTVMPRNQSRYQFAVFCGQISVLYLILHEYFHLHRKHHLILKTDEKVRFAFESFVGLSTSPEMVYLNKATEIDADTQAAEYLLLYLIMSQMEQKKDIGTTILAFSFGIAVLFKTFGLNKSAGNFRERRYPSSNIRAEFVLGEMATYLQTFPNIDIIKKGRSELDYVWQKLGWAETKIDNEELSWTKTEIYPLIARVINGRNSL